MRKLLAIVLTVPALLIGATMVGGHITWDRTWGPDTVLVTDSVQVDSGVTLTVAPGTRVLFTGYFKLKVLGRLLAEGTAEDSILFSARDTLVSWRGMRFTSPDTSMDSSRLSFCRIQYGTASGTFDNECGGGLLLTGPVKLSITHSAVSNNKANGLGGGIYCRMACPVISSTEIVDNWAADSGGGVYCAVQGNALFDSVLISGNGSGRGGGLYCDFSSPRISNSVITDNYGSYQGGGLCCYYAAPTLVSVKLTYNRGFTAGGGMYCRNCTGIRIVNSLISNNTAPLGAALYCWTASPTLIHSTIANNTSSNSFSYLYLLSSSPFLSGCVLWGNQPKFVELINTSTDPSFVYCDLEGGYASLTGNGSGTYYRGSFSNNQDLDPLFIDSSLGDFSLDDLSPCINAGNPDTTWLGLPGLDLAGNPRIFGIATDMGAFENQSVTVAEANSLPAGMPFLQNCPNPFKTATQFRFAAPIDNARVEVFDIRDKKVCFMEGVKATGFRLDLGDVNSGIYLVRVVSGANRYQKAVTVIK